jgi:8-amino-7-oxononanoate synthase
VTWLSILEDEAVVRAEAGLRRELRPRCHTDTVVDLAGNDYLGLAAHPEVVAATINGVTEYGLGAAGSRLVRGSTDQHTALENGLADLLGTESALVYSSGYLANLGAIRALVRPGTLVVSDAHNHASLVDGCRIACAGKEGRGGARTVVVAHYDVAAVRDAITSHNGPSIVVTESLFSVDGDLAPIADLYAVTHEAGALLLVDEAHAVGVVGPSGAGGVAAAGLAGAPDLVVTATLSKSVGAAGGVVAGPAQLQRHLVDTGRTFIYDTALPPGVTAGAFAALRLLRAADDRRAVLHKRAASAATCLRDNGLTVSPPDGGIISVAAPGPAEAVAWAAACREHDIAVGCFRPPSTPDGRARLRLTVNAGIAADAFERAIDVVLKTKP